MADLRTVIAERCPQIAVETIVPLGEGDFCTAHLVNDEWVFRFAKHGDAAVSLRREACVLPKIADRVEVAVPSPEIVDLHSAPAFVAHRMLPGPELTKDRYLGLIEADRDRCAGQVGAFLAQLHSTDVELVRPCGLSTMAYAARGAEVLGHVREHALPHLTAEDRAFVEERLGRHEPDAVEPVVLHGDLSPEHVMYDEATRSVSAVIDFGDVTLGDPAWDLVYIYEDYGLDFLRRAIQAYAPSDARALLERTHRFHTLDLVQWVADCAARHDPELAHAVEELTSLRITEDRRLGDLLRTCLG
jgi:aminoglycoside 2''-phosphotransferase